MSSFALGAVLFQKEDTGWRCDVAYFSKALSATERNYDIWDREFLAIVTAFRTWQHLLARTQDPIQVFTDHANLQYYRHLQKINRWVARYINFLEDFNYQLKHVPGICNHADALLRRPDYDDGVEDNKQVVALPDSVFIQVLSTATLDKRIRKQQCAILNTLASWRNAHALVQKEDHSWYKGHALVVSGGDQDKRELLQLYHDAQVVGHPGVAKTLWTLSQDYWWPGMRTF